jgi:cell division protein FtsN
VNKVLIMVAFLALGALGLAFVFRNQTSNAKTVTLEPNKVIKSAKPNSSVKSAGSLEDLTKNAPEPRAVTTDAIVVPPKPTPTVSNASEVISAKPEVVKAKSEVVKAKPEVRVSTPVDTSSQVTKPVPEITKPIEQPQQVPSNAETPTASTETSNTAEKPVTTETNSSVPAPALPLRRSPGSVSIQAGAFKNADNAEAMRVQLSSQGFKTSVELGEDGISRVIVGPYPNEQTARDAMSKISNR